MSNYYLSPILIYLLQTLFTICSGSAGNPDTDYRFPIGQEISYKSNSNYVLTLETDSQVQVDSESMHLKFRTRQKENSVIALGRTNEHSFKIELSDGRLVFHFTDDSDLSISSYSLPSNHLNDGEWHRLIVKRSKSKFEVSIDGLKYSEISFNKPLIENVFAGSRITLGFENDLHRMIKYDGEISEVIISINNIPLRIKELPISYNDIYNEANYPEQSNGIDKVIIRVDMAPGSSVYLRPHDPPLTLLYNDEKHVDSFGVSFRTSTDGIIASLIGAKSKNLIGLEIVDKRLFLIVQNDNALLKTPQRKELGITDYNAEYTVHLRNDRQGDLGVISAWLTSNRQSPVSFKVTDPFLIDRISFGGSETNSHDSTVFINSVPISGCIKKPYLNLFTLNLKPLLGTGRSDCSDKFYRFNSGVEFKRRLIDHVEAITFRYGDRPLPFTYAESDRKKFKSLEIDFATVETSGIIASLHDNKDNFIAIFISNGLLYMIIDDKNIEQQSFKISDKLVNDGQYHRIRVVNSISAKEHDYAELDSQQTRFPKPLSDEFYLTTVYFAAADFWAKDHYSLASVGNFFGCMKNILFNGEYIIRYDHVLDKSRINAGCQPVASTPLPSITYLKPDISFSCKKQNDAVNIKLSNSEEFNSLKIPLNTFIVNGVIATLSSTFDQKSIVLYVQSGGLNLAYLDNAGKELHLTTGKIINDGDQHSILLKREPIPGRIILSINDQTYNVDIPIGSSPLFFDKLTIGGSGKTLRFMPDKHSGAYQGCFQHIEYNKASVVPNNVISEVRRKCSVIGKSVCDVENQFCKSNQQYGHVEQTLNLGRSVSNQNFCPSMRCSIFCQANDESEVSFQRSFHASLQQEIFIVFRTNDHSSQLFKTEGVTDVVMSLFLKDKYLFLNIESNGRTITLEFPKQIISDANHHVAIIRRNQNQVNLTIDDHKTVHSVKSMLKKKLTFDKHYICSGQYQGFIEDIIFNVDSSKVSLLDEIVNKPTLARIGPGAAWENRHSLRQREKRMAPCTTLNCDRGEIECQVKQTEINYKVSSTTKVCTCVDPASRARELYCEAREDPCARIDCIHGTCIVDSGRAVCQCISGYTGDRCEQQVDPCVHSPCQNDGTCYPQGISSFICICTTQFTGRFCESPTQKDPCHNIQCQNGGYCHNGQCQCSEDFTGQLCERPLDLCRHISCQNGGHCLQGSCRCPTSFSGTYCEVTDPCHNIQCQNGGYCHNGQCQCSEDFTGQLCERPLDLCRHISCQNGGHCLQGSCRCPTSFSGTYCEVTDPCHNIQCQNGGYCHNGQCQCSEDFTGQLCERPLDLCRHISCQNGGHCLQGSCRCPTSFSGTYCEVTDKCHRIKCLHGGACQEGQCKCPENRMGTFCEFENKCYQIECLHGGTCNEGQCKCPENRIGTYCELEDLCYSISCLNGQCHEGKCICGEGFAGSECEKAIDTCLSVQCRHGQCIDGACLCDSGYEGKYCDIIAVIPPAWSSRDPLQGGLIEYGRVPRTRGKHLGAIFAIVSGLALGALAGAFAARKCAEGACVPASSAVTTIPVTTDAASSDHIATMIDRTVPTLFTATNAAAINTRGSSHLRTEDEQMLLPNITDRSNAAASGIGAGQTERVETIHERTIERDYGKGSGSAYGAAFPAVFGPVFAAPFQQHTTDFYTAWPTEQTERLVEAQMFDDSRDVTSGASFAYQPPPIGDFGYGPSGHVSHQISYNDAESWDTSGQVTGIGAPIGSGTNNLQMNAMAGGVAGVDYELSNINTLTMTPNGKYAIVGQSQGPPQIWDAQVRSYIYPLRYSILNLYCKIITYCKQILSTSIC
ncbi:hypothetical protein GJ496_005757 [Pomphorhynchus laevis]|nr:hypothetical protein GJ496_005757 [Pomphorhynchus laevis]